MLNTIFTVLYIIVLLCCVVSFGVLLLGGEMDDSEEKTWLTVLNVSAVLLIVLSGAKLILT